MTNCTLTNFLQCHISCLVLVRVDKMSAEEKRLEWNVTFICVCGGPTISQNFLNEPYYTEQQLGMLFSQLMPLM